MRHPSITNHQSPTSIFPNEPIFGSPRHPSVPCSPLPLPPLQDPDPPEYKFPSQKQEILAYAPEPRTLNAHLMSAYRKNILVGLVMVGALIILGWMIIKFGGATAGIFVAKQIPVQLISDRADGVGDGSAVSYRGVVVGRVTAVHLAEDNKQVAIDAVIDSKPPLPENVEGTIRSVGLVGGVAAVGLDLVGQANGKISTRPDHHHSLSRQRSTSA